MIKFTSVIDEQSFHKIKNREKTVKFFLCDDKRKGLSVGDKFVLLNNQNVQQIVVVEKIDVSKNLKQLVRLFPLQNLGETDYDMAYKNIKQWFSDENIKKLSIMAVTIRIDNE